MKIISFIYRVLFCRFNNHLRIDYVIPGDVSSAYKCVDCGKQFPAVNWPRPRRK